MSGTDIAKNELFQAVIAQVEAKLQELKAGYGAARDAVLSTPHVMKSKREVFGQESAYLANALALNIQEREHELRTLRGMRLAENPQCVALGCLVGVGIPDGGAEEWYLVLPVCGGMEVLRPGSGTSVRVVTPGTPVAKALLGKSVGDEAALPTNPPRVVVIRLMI